ncbi:MAG: DUF2064 domain-containing protein [Pseudomonadales bacterium]|nr:DUF2064 domain-containing protein [Pseudomonadales bacterium]
MSNKINKTAVVVFVKTPGLSPVKTRLANTIGEASAIAFYLLSIEAIKSVLSRLPIDRFECFWAVTEQKALKNPLWRDFTALYSGNDSPINADIGVRMSVIYHKLEKQYRNVVLLGADCPQITGLQIDRAQSLNQQNNCTVIGPSNDGGFYLLCSHASISDNCWQNTTWSSPDTLSEFSKHLKTPNMLLNPLTDIDTVQDIPNACREFAALVDQGFKLSSQQQHVFSWLKSCNPSAYAVKNR